MGRKRSWFIEVYFENGIVFNKNLSRNFNFGFDNVFIYVIWNVKEI